MDLSPPPSSRPAEHLLRAHRAHAGHHEQLAEEQHAQLESAIADASSPPPAPARRPRKRRTKEST